MSSGICKIFYKNQKKVTPKNYQDLSSLIWKQNTQSLTLLWQHTTTVFEISISWIICNLRFLKIVVSRNWKQLDILNWQSNSPRLRLLWQPSTTAQEFQILNKEKLIFRKNFRKNYKKNRHIWKTKKLWALIFGGETRNSWERKTIVTDSGSTQI